jgi:hypothetical protein
MRIHACRVTCLRTVCPLPGENGTKRGRVWTPLRSSRLILLNIAPHFGCFSTDRMETLQSEEKRLALLKRMKIGTHRNRSRHKSSIWRMQRNCHWFVPCCGPATETGSYNETFSSSFFFGTTNQWGGRPYVFSDAWDRPVRRPKAIPVTGRGGL